VQDNGGCVFVTAFSGLFAPYWIDDAKGTIFGITQFTERGHIARATLEATCFQTKAILDAMELDSGHKLNMLAVDGGMSNSNLCMQVSGSMRRTTERNDLYLHATNRHKQTSLVSQLTGPLCVKQQHLVLQ
jgi:glycerol kinase